MVFAANWDKMSLTYLSLDIGGANLKASDSTGRAESVGFAIYREPDRLADEIRSLAGSMVTPQCVLVTMTAELCDCFETRRQGVLKIISDLETIYNPGILRIWGVDGLFHSTLTIKNRPALAEASNWKALGDCLAADYFQNQTGLVIDIGSTTTDILAVAHGKLLSVSTTDIDRLQSGELVYLGVSRTPLCAVADSVKFRTTNTPLMRELFATTGDVYWTLGELPESPEDLSTANGRPATRVEARHRLARMIGLDYERFTEKDASSMATQIDSKIYKTLEKSIRKVAEALPDGVVNQLMVSGSGSFLAERIGSKIFPRASMFNLETIWGRDQADAACAVALIKLADAGLKR